MAGGKRKTASSKQKSGEKSSDPPGKTFKSIKKEIRKQCRTTLCNFYWVSYKYFKKLVTSTKFKCDVIMDLKIEKYKIVFCVQ